MEYCLMRLPSGNTPRRSDRCRFLGLIFNDKDWDKGHYYLSFPDNGSVLFTNVVACLGGGFIGRGGEDPEIAAAVKAGLGPLMPMAVEASAAARGHCAQTPLLSSHLREWRGGAVGAGESQRHPLTTTWGRSRRSVAGRRGAHRDRPGIADFGTSVSAIALILR